VPTMPSKSMTPDLIERVLLAQVIVERRRGSGLFALAVAYIGHRTGQRQTPAEAASRVRLSGQRRRRPSRVAPLSSGTARLAACPVPRPSTRSGLIRSAQGPSQPFQLRGRVG
jgi:hypothetical protein